MLYNFMNKIFWKININSIVKQYLILKRSLIQSDFPFLVAVKSFDQRLPGNLSFLNAPLLYRKQIICFGSNHGSNTQILRKWTGIFLVIWSSPNQTIEFYNNVKGTVSRDEFGFWWYVWLVLGLKRGRGHLSIF